ncbi:hydroxyacid dehydrogenase [Ferrovibrio xuzhouensis]|uniref:Hydroxyacid dehydrogenase n=1 Tax=Ferrovibrio xuzhouensis TaxID=1576914 RepID=A0ABV7VLL3_9PROT
MTDLPLVLATNPLDPSGEDLLLGHVRLLVAPDTSAGTLNRLAGEAEGIIVRVPLPSDILEHAPRLRAIVRHGAGLDMIPMVSATARRIPVAYVPGANATAVAEYCFAVMLKFGRRLGRVDDGLRIASWQEVRQSVGSAGELAEKTLGIVGFGNIGRRVAAIGAGFGMRLLAHTPRPENLPDGITAVDLAGLFSQADFIVLCCPLNDRTRGMVDAGLLRQVRPGGRLINVSRGAVIVDEALAEALRSGRLAAAALDVFAVQPLPASHVFFGLPNLLLTPHIAGLTQESLRRMSQGAAEEMLRMLHGERPRNLANPEIYG